MTLKNWLKPQKMPNPPPSRPLEPLLLARFKKILHTQQLDIFVNVLQLSLVNLQDSLSRIVLGKGTYGQHITLFDKTADELYHGIIRLNLQLTKEGAWDRTPRRNLLLTIFVFYRILFRDLLTALSPDENYSASQDRYSLIKRVPPQVIYQAGAEYWRLYELATLIYGDVNELRLNADLKPILHMLFEKDSPTTHSEKAACLMDDELLPETSSSEMSVDCMKEALSFLAWVEESVLHGEKGFEPNVGRIFVDTLNYDNRTLFIAEAVLTEWSGASALALMAGLDNLGRLEESIDARYHVVGSDLPLVRLFVDLDLNDIAITTPVVIERLA